MNKKKKELTPKQRKNYIITAIIMLLLMSIVVLYSLSVLEEEERLLSENYAFTTCKIIKSYPYKRRTTIEYTVLGKKYKRIDVESHLRYSVGEYFALKYSKTNPEVCDIIYEDPKIDKYEDYIEATGLITFVRPDYITLKYSFNGKEHERSLYINKPDVKKFVKGKSINILINKTNPTIGYVKDLVTIKK